MRTYYNEWDAATAMWLSELGNCGHLPPGYVDTRSIRDVCPSDLHGYQQCHFFAGIGGWPLALWLAGYGDLPCWTGSPPCQPFSVAGQQRGKGDERHLAPIWLNLVKECRPPVLFGEQVADAIKHGWLDDLFNTLEECGYACGAAVLPACGIGAPHIRKRLFFGAIRLEYADLQYIQPAGNSTRAKNSGGPSQNIGMAYSDKNRCVPGREIRPVCAEYDPEHGGAARGMDNTNNARPQRWAGMPERADKQPTGPGSVESKPASSGDSFWSGADWLGCRDGKLRPVEPGTQPLAHGIPARVGRLRGYGNAIVPQVAAAFIKDFLGTVAEIQSGET